MKNASMSGAVALVGIGLITIGLGNFFKAPDAHAGVPLYSAGQKHHDRYHGLIQYVVPGGGIRRFLLSMPMARYSRWTPLRPSQPGSHFSIPHEQACIGVDSLRAILWHTHIGQV